MVGKFIRHRQCVGSSVLVISVDTLLHFQPKYIALSFQNLHLQYSKPLKKLKFEMVTIPKQKVLQIMAGSLEASNKSALPI